MMIDCSPTISLVRNHGLPIAIMIISAFLVISERFWVAELQLVTVAQALISMSAIGLPTILDLPITAICLPFTSIL
jgi:hypothetical protein